MATLYDFLGDDIINPENEKKLEESIFIKLNTEKDFYEIISFVNKIENYEVKKYISEKIIEKYFRKIKIIYKDGKIIYGNFEEEINISLENIKEIIPFISLSEIDREIIISFLSNDLNKRIKALKTVFLETGKNKWNEEELKQFSKKLRPMTKKFMEILLKKGEEDSEEICREMGLKNKKSVSALVSSVKRNAPADKEKIIYKSEDKIIINSEYRETLIKLLKE